jgi:hypothetical protein
LIIIRLTGGVLTAAAQRAEVERITVQKVQDKFLSASASALPTEH